ncbi:MAG: amidohydrolase family protein [Anaerolineaceae bacterium]
MHLTSAECANMMNEKLGEAILGTYKPAFHDADEIIAVLDRSGVQKAFALSNAYQWGMDLLGMPAEEIYDWVKFENDFTARECAKYPDRLLPFMSIHPLQDYALEEMDRCANQLGLRALKMHFTNSNVDLRNPEHLAGVKKVMAKAAELEMPVLLHFMSRNPEFGADDAFILIDEIIARHPALKIQMAHLGYGGLGDTMMKMFDAFIQRYEANPQLNKDNCKMDLAAVISDGSKPLTAPITPEQCQYVTDQIRRWGVEHVLFATDWPIFEPYEFAENVRKMLYLTDEEVNTLLSNRWLFE